MFFELLLQHINTINLKRFISTKLAKQTRPKGLVFCLVGEDIGFERRPLASVRWTLATAVARPLLGESVPPSVPSKVTFFLLK